jgi:hypothetical protein
MRERYLPTTEEIREASRKGFVASMGYRSVSDEEFDYWLFSERQRVADLATAKLIDKIKAIRDANRDFPGDYDYYYGVDALLEELGYSEQNKEA